MLLVIPDHATIQFPQLSLPSTDTEPIVKKRAAADYYLDFSSGINASPPPGHQPLYNSLMVLQLFQKICNHLYLIKRASCESLHFTPIY
jgi:hypothetical protein